MRPDWQGAHHAGVRGRRFPDRSSKTFTNAGRVHAWHPQGTEKEGGESRVTEGLRGGSFFFLNINYVMEEEG